MDRREFITMAGGSILAAPFAVEAQQPGKVYRVGVLTNKVADPAKARLWQAFRSGLRERGWIEGPEHRDRVPGCRGRHRLTSGTRC